MAKTSKTKKGGNRGKGVTVITPKAQACYAYVWEPRESLNKDKPPQYSIRLLFDRKTDLSKLKKAASQAAKNFFGDRIPKGLESPFHDGNDKDDPIFKNKIYINAKSNTKPGIVDADVNPIMDQSDFYSGCMCKASVYAFAYDTAGNQGVAFLLNNIQKIGDGPRLSGRKAAEDEFEEEDTEDAEGADEEDDDDEDAPRRAKKSKSRRSRDEDDEDEEEDDEDEEEDEPRRSKKRKSSVFD